MRRFFLRAAVAIAVVAVGSLLAFFIVAQLGALKPYAIPSSAMEPTLHCARPAPGCEADHRDRVLVLRWGVSFGRGDIVVFKATRVVRARCGAGGRFVKRIVGLPGEKVQDRLLRGKDYVFVDGKQLDEPYIQPDRRSADPTKTYTVPPDHYFMLGDNRASSCDSRSFGPVPKESLEGKVVLTYWPPGRVSFR